MRHDPYGRDSWRDEQFDDRRDDWSDDRRGWLSNERWRGERRHFARPDRYMRRDEAERLSGRVGEGEWGWQVRPQRGGGGLFERARAYITGEDLTGAPDGSRPDFRGRGPRGYRRSDARIAEDVCERLAEDSWLDASDIEVEVKDREITLSGLVASREDRRRAERLAEDCPGVEHVQNNLRVRD